MRDPPCFHTLQKDLHRSSTIMLSRVAVTTLSRRLPLATATAPVAARRAMTTVQDAATADDALKFSGYQQIDFTIKDTASVYEAVQKFAAYNIGCLVTTDEAGTFRILKGKGDEFAIHCLNRALGTIVRSNEDDERDCRGAMIALRVLSLVPLLRRGLSQLTHFACAVAYNKHRREHERHFVGTRLHYQDCLVGSYIERHTRQRNCHAGGQHHYRQSHRIGRIVHGENDEQRDPSFAHCR